MVEAFGEKSTLLFEVRWSAKSAATSAEATRGALRLWANGRQVWPGGDLDEAFEWTWVELAEFLARSWRWLQWENGFLFELPGGSITEMYVDLDRRWSLLSMAAREEEEADLYSFEERHDLARGLMGATAPSVWLVREGNMCWVSTQDSAALVSFAAVEEALQGFVGAVISRLEGVDERASAVKAEWAARSRVTTGEFVAIATGLERGALSQLQGDHDPMSFWEVDARNFVATELMAAARLAAPLPMADTAQMLRAIREAVKENTSALDALTTVALQQVPAGPEWYPYDQGYFVADWLRAQIGAAAQDSVDPEELLKRWGVQIQTLKLSTDAVDAVASWGPRHGPVVIVNTAGVHNSSRQGLRATYAHEIAHLILDRTTALPLAEVLGGRAAGNTEVRARAFAAQLLLPKEEAGRALADAIDPVQTVIILQRRYRVSREIVAWQARNSDIRLSSEVHAALRSFVSRPGRF
ncbi:MAG: ImmA/IrrE family metallo-endopeptidase [Trebonia sp.]